jgi:hypothetical protein
MQMNMQFLILYFQTYVTYLWWIKLIHRLGRETLNAYKIFVGNLMGCGSETDEHYKKSYGVV